MEMEIGNGIGKLEMVVKYSYYNLEYLWHMYRMLRSSLVLRPSQYLNVH